MFDTLRRAEFDAEDKQILFSSAIVRVEKTRCQRASRGLSCEECKTEHQIAVPLSGVNMHHLGGETYTTTPSHITLSNRGDPYRVSHPHGSGETQLTLIVQEKILLDLLAEKDPRAIDRNSPFDRHQLPIAPKLRLALQLLLNAAKRKSCSNLEFEEIALSLVDRMLVGLAAPSKSTVSRRDRELAHETRSALARLHTQPLALEDLASMLRVSVFHLCRVYKRATGATLWSEIQRLRTREALVHLENNERDLTTLGLRLGYSHHSHFTASFRREVGITPSSARRLLQTGSVSQVRELLKKSTARF